MSNTITLTEPQVNALMASWTGIQLERGPLSTGPFTLVVQIPYVLNQTIYSYVDAPGALTDWYRTARYSGVTLGAYSSAWPVSLGQGITLTQYRHRLADAAGINIQTLTTGSATLANQVVVSDFQSTELGPSFLGNTWEYQPTGVNAGQVRRVVYGGLQNGTGTVTVERAHSALTPSGTAVEFYGKLPPVRYEGRLGLNDLVNKVLDECWTIQKLPIAGVLNQRLYPVGTIAPFLQAEDQVVEVYYQPANSDPLADDLLMINWRWVPGGDQPGIEIAQLLNVGDTLKIQCFVPMSWWTNTGSGFALTTNPGLHNETDMALLPLIGMEVIGASYVDLEMSKWGLPDDQKQFLAMRAQHRAAANQWKRLTLEHPQVRKRHWPSVLTVRSRDNFGYGQPTYTTPG